MIITDNNKIKTSELMEMLRAKFPVYSYWSNKELDKEFPAPKESTTREFADSIEPDLLNKSYEDMEDKDIMTFRERLIAELEYFNKTGNHLDIKGWTITSSRSSDGGVASAYWSDVGFKASWRFAGLHNSSAGGREAVSLKPSTLNTADEAITLLKKEGYIITKQF